MNEWLRRVLFGTDEAVPETVSLRAGGLDLVLRGAKVWHICCGDVEVWHGIAFVFRDPDWGTPEPVVDHVESTISESAFRLRGVGHFPVSPAIEFRFEIEGAAPGRVRFAAEAVPQGDIQANRLGLCLLHPMSVRGARVEIEHTDGRVSGSTFPTLIPPWPPFMLIRAIRHEYAPDRWARCIFAGDVFELEDQRNNSDASFKTYSRSNMMPHPYWLRAGVPVKQSLELTLDVPCARSRRLGTRAVTVGVGKEVRELPRIGVEISPRDIGASEAIRAALRRLHPAHLHVRWSPDAHIVDWKETRTLLGDAGAVLRLDVVLPEVAASGEVLAALRNALHAAGLEAAGIAVFPSEPSCIDAARAAFPASAIGGGTPHFFVQLNRLEFLGAIDFLTFTTSPIVHGADDDTVMLSLRSLPSMIESLRARYPGARIAVGPSSISMRASPLGQQPESDGLHRIALARRDPRSRGLYGAAWALGYVAQLATADVDAITLASLTGDAGVLGRDQEGNVCRYPAYFVLERLRAPARVCEMWVSQPTRLAALAVRRDQGREVLIANLTADSVDVELDGWAAPFSLATMDADTWPGFGSASDAWSAFRRPWRKARLRLPAYAVASVETPG